MKIVLTACLLATAGALAFAESGSYPDGYWDRQYGYAQQWSVMYNVSLKVQSPSSAREEAVRILEKAGARPAQGGFYGFQRPGQAVQISYLIPVDKAERAAKRLFDLGDLQQYTNQKMGMTAQLPEIQEKIEALQSEMKENTAALERMPIARTIETSQLNRLAQARDATEASAGTAIISVALADASASDAPQYAYGGTKVAKKTVKIADLPDNERSAKGDLGAVRSALSIYYGDAEGRYPAKLSDLTIGGKYLSAIPKIQIGAHKLTDAVLDVKEVSGHAALRRKLKDTGGWAYVSDPKSPIYGTVVIDCTHTDTRSSVWAEY